MDGQTDESDFIGHCPTNVERPISDLFKVNNGNSKKIPKKRRHQTDINDVVLVSFLSTLNIIHFFLVLNLNR